MTGTNPKLVHFPPIRSNDSEPPNRENTVTAPRKYHRSFFEVFQFLKTKRHDRSVLLQSDPDPSQKKGLSQTNHSTANFSQGGVTGGSFAIQLAS
jgi:hypothetical protein